MTFDTITEMTARPHRRLRVVIALAAVTMVAACATTPPAGDPSDTESEARAKVEDNQQGSERQRRPEADPKAGPEPAEPAAETPEPPAEPETASNPRPASEPESSPRAKAPETIEKSAPVTESPAPARPSGQTPAPESTPSSMAETQPDPQPGAQPTGAAQALNRRITGQIEVLRNGREQRFAATHLEQTVVAWRPEGSEGVRPMAEQQIVTRRSRFYPQTMVVTSGTQVRFPNLDEVRHNVFSLTPDHRFDVGVYGPDEGVATVFEGVGTVEIFCNIHPNMAAFLLVLDTTHYTSPDQEGRFRLEGLPAGPGELLVWNYRAEEQITRRSLTDSNRLGETVEMTINITRPSVPQHTTKEGRPYYRPSD